MLKMLRKLLGKMMRIGGTIQDFDSESNGWDRLYVSYRPFYLSSFSNKKCLESDLQPLSNKCSIAEKLSLPSLFHS